MFFPSRKSDIENERLPPDLYDAESEEGRAILSSGPASPEGSPATPPPAAGVAQALEHAISTGSVTPVSTSGPSTPASPASPTGPPPVPFRRGHGRQASLGTTMTSPSTRRRSIESTMSLIKEVVDSKIPIQDPELLKLAESVAGSQSSTRTSAPPSPS